MNIAILIPTFFRHKGLRRALQTLNDTAHDVHSVVITEPDDWKASLTAEEFRVQSVACPAARRGSGQAWNLGLATAPGFDAYILGSDDCYYLPGWYEGLTDCMKLNGNSGLFGLNDGTGIQHFCMTRDFIIDYNGGVMVMPYYRGWYQDFEACERARRAGKYFFAEGAKIVHAWRGSATRNYAKLGKILYEQRLAEGFPDNYPPVLTE